MSVANKTKQKTVKGVGAEGEEEKQRDPEPNYKWMI